MEFIAARWFTPTNGRRIDYLVLHDMEAPEASTTAEAVARYFATTATKASAHYCIDDDSTVQCVREQDIAYHAPPNLHSLGLEHAGYARQSRDQWLDPFGVKMLTRSAALVAELLAKYDLPVEFLSVADLKAGGRGITTHRNVSLAFGQSTHTDPGPDFPVGWYMDRVREALGDDVTDQDKHDIANLVLAKMFGDEWTPALRNQMRLALDGEFGDESGQGAFSDRIAAKVAALIPATQGVDLDALRPVIDATVAATIDALLPLRVVKG